MCDNGAKTLRQIREEEDDEERYQEDLKELYAIALENLFYRYFTCSDEFCIPILQHSN